MSSPQMMRMFGCLVAMVITPSSSDLPVTGMVDTNCGTLRALVHSEAMPSVRESRWRCGPATRSRRRARREKDSNVHRVPESRDYDHACRTASHVKLEIVEPGIVQRSTGGPAIERL